MVNRPLHGLPSFFSYQCLKELGRGHFLPQFLHTCLCRTGNVPKWQNMKKTISTNGRARLKSPGPIRIRFLQTGNTCQSWTKEVPNSVDPGNPIMHGQYGGPGGEAPGCFRVLGTTSKFDGNSLSLQCKDRASDLLPPLSLRPNFRLIPYRELHT